MDMITVSILQKSHLQVLTSGMVVAVRVARFLPLPVCCAISERLKTSQHLGRYKNAPLIGRAGQAFFECAVSSEDETRYWDHALEWVRELRACCQPVLSPIDKFRLELDEVWPCGATIQTLGGRKMFVGLVRLFSDLAYAEAHQDLLEWDAKSCDCTADLEGQFSANIYLEMPPKGGELCIWNRSFNLEEYQKLQNKNSYGIDGSSLRDESLCIAPQVGDLILFNSRNIHAVQPSIGGERITWSTFIGYRGPDEPLTLWS